MGTTRNEIPTDAAVTSDVVLTPYLNPTLDFIANIVASIAWPITVIIIAFMFRAHIINALKNIKSFSFGGASATFENDLRRASENATAFEPSPDDIRDLNDDRKINLLKMTVISPSAAVVQAWIDVEQAARRVVEQSGLPLGGDKSRPFFSLQRFLSEKKLLPDAEISSFRELRMMRNRAAHNGQSDISADQARKYIELSDRLVDSINSIAEKAKTSA